MILLSIFSALYEAVIGRNPQVPAFRDAIFNSVGLLSLIIAIVICFLFYVAFGRWKSVWYSRVHWFITVFICAAIGFLLAVTQTKNLLGMVDSYTISFSLFNALYTALYFIIFSFLFKNFSIYSKRTPL